MNYFVNENIFTLNSGTEFSAVKRLRLFHKQGLKAKILTKNYNPNLSGDLERVGLEHQDVLNMYDYFQGLTDLPKKVAENDVRYADVIDKKLYHIEGVDGNESLIKYHGETIAKVLIAPGTVGLIGNIEYYNAMNTVVTRDIWDNRGFKSSTQYYHPNGELGPQIFFDLDGNPKIEITHMNYNGNLIPTMYKLLSYKDRVIRFNSEEEMFIFFMNEICAQEPSVLINDRPSLTPAVAAVQGAAGKWQFLHNAHSRNNDQKTVSKKVVDYLQPLFNIFAPQFDGLITATEKQRDEIAAISNFKKVIALPDSYAEAVKSNELDFDLEKRVKNKIVYLGLISDEKGVADTVDVLSRVQKKLPEARIEFYGYPSPAEKQKQIEEAAEKAEIKDSIVFKGYQTEDVLATELKSAALVINLSSSEAFGMSLLHAMSFGVPAVAYDVKYLSELIEPEVNGELAQRGSKQGMADKVVAILTDPEKWSEMSRAAFDKAQAFSEDSAWEKWQAAKVANETLFVED